MNEPRRFVKSWDTDVTVARSKGALEELLRRYGATGFTVSEDYASGTVLIGFNLPRSIELPADKQDSAEIAFTISYNQVLRRLRSMKDFRTKENAKAFSNREAWATEQAARVAWRHLVLWADAALSSVDAGLQSLEEAFFAQHILTDGVRRLKAADAVAIARKAIGSGSGS
jgi:hypothetical protein